MLTVLTNRHVTLGCVRSDVYKQVNKTQSILCIYVNHTPVYPETWLPVLGIWKTDQDEGGSQSQYQFLLINILI